MPAFQSKWIHRGLSAGIDTIRLTSADAPVLALTITLGTFNLPEALQVGETYLAPTNIAQVSSPTFPHA